MVNLSYHWHIQVGVKTSTLAKPNGKKTGRVRKTNTGRAGEQKLQLETRLTVGETTKWKMEEKVAYPEHVGCPGWETILAPGLIYYMT